jgi:transglutaminase-like putative cysteine protease
VKAQLFEVTHTTVYEYATPVAVAHHLLRLSPRLLARQLRLSHRIELRPEPAHLSRHTDYFGNEVCYASLTGEHQRLEITARSRMAVGPRFIPDPGETPAWEVVRALCRTDRSKDVMEAHEFTFSSPSVPLDARLRDYALPSFAPGRPLLEAVVDLMGRIHADFRFDPTATTVSTPLLDVLASRRGVCQDFAHLQIGCLRSLGLPARYVSGYLETLPPPGQQKLIGADASHAWVAVHCPGMGWIDVDPTNDVLPSMRHITLGWGRDYGDVSPVRGVLVGGDPHQLTVGVDVLPQGEAVIRSASLGEY